MVRQPYFVFPLRLFVTTQDMSRDGRTRLTTTDKRPPVPKSRIAIVIAIAIEIEIENKKPLIRTESANSTGLLRIAFARHLEISIAISSTIAILDFDCDFEDRKTVGLPITSHLGDRLMLSTTLRNGDDAQYSGTYGTAVGSA